jgi:hypothetical protein
MTDRQKLDLAELKLKLFQKYLWTCEVCKRPLATFGTPQLAHRISQSKMNLRKYGEEIIHHELNLAPVCCLKCNSAVLIDRNPEQTELLIDRILEAIDRRV